MSGFDFSAILALLGLILILILNIKDFMAKASKRQCPPGPKPWPVIGNLHILNLKRPYQTMLEVRHKYINDHSHCVCACVCSVCICVCFQIILILECLLAYMC